MVARAINGRPAVIAAVVLVVLTCCSSLTAIPAAVAVPVCTLYLLGLLVGPVSVERTGSIVYFPAQLAASLAIVAIWPDDYALTTMAFVSHVTVYLRARHAAVVLVTLAVGSIAIAAPPFAGIVGYVTAFAFVVAFSRIAANHHDARQRATELAAQLAIARDHAAELAGASERNRIAREVHDGLGHTLTIAHVQLEAAAELVRRDPARAEHVIGRVRGVIRAGLDDVRASVQLLREDRPLRDALATWAADLRDEGVEVELALPAETPASQASRVLYRAAQEALTNVRKHAAANKVAIAVSREGDAWRLRVADDGRGAAQTGSGFGLRGIAERAASAGGHVAIATEPGRGFALVLEVPA